MIRISASSSVRPRVRSLMICSPAILPMAASWMGAYPGSQLCPGGAGGAVHDFSLGRPGEGRNEIIMEGRTDLSQNDVDLVSVHPLCQVVKDDFCPQAHGLLGGKGNVRGQ